MTENGNDDSQSNSGDQEQSTQQTTTEKTSAENLATCIFYLDQDFNLIRVSDSFARATGYRAEDLAGKNLFDILPIQKYKQLFHSTLESGRPYFAEREPLQLKQESGTMPGYWDISIHPVLGLEGTPARLVVTLADVTQRERALQALKESNELFQRMFDSSPDANLLVHLGGTIAKINRQTERLFGYRQDELSGKSIETLVPETMRDRHSLQRLRYMEAPYSRSMSDELELYARHKDGQEFPVEVSLSPLKVDGETQILVVVRDISQRIVAQSALQEKNEIVRLLRDVAVAANGARSVEEALRFALDRTCAFLGWPIGQAYLVDHKGITLTDIYHADEPERFAIFREESRSKDFSGGQGMVGRVVMREGPEWLADIQTNPDFTRREIARQAGLKTGLALPILTGKETAAVLEFFTDRVVQPIPAFLEILPHVVTQLGRVVERVRSEQELTRSEARFRAIFEGSAIGILMTDINGKVVLSNPALEEMLNYPAGGLNGLNMQDLLQPEEAAKHRAQVRALLAETGLYPPLELRYRLKNGSAVWGRNVASVVYDAGGSPRYVITMVEDITQQKQMQDELTELRRLMNTNLENERIRLAQDLHDGPIQDLYVINMQLSGLIDEAQDSETVQETMNAVENVIASLRDTITELRPPTLVDFGLERAIRSHAERLKENAPELKLHLDLESDQQRLSQQARLALFRNYKSAISNVMRHAQARNLWVRFRIEGEQAILEIQDDGQGFQFPQRLVELVREGHLGLVGMLERAEAMGGKLKVNATPGKGALLRTEIPCVEEKA